MASMYLGSSGEWKMDKACCQGNLRPAEVSLRCAILSKVLSGHTSYDPKGHGWDRTPQNAGAVTVHTQWQLRQVTPKRSQYNRQNWTHTPRTVWVAALKARIQEEGWSQLPQQHQVFTYTCIYSHTWMFCYVRVHMDIAVHKNGPQDAQQSPL